MEKLKKYIFKTIKDELKILIAGLLFIIIGIILLVSKNNSNLRLGIIIEIVGILSIYNIIMNIIKQNKYIKDLINNNKIDSIINDFNKSKSYSEDTIRIGNEYIFRNKIYEIINIKDIKSIRYLNKTNMHESEVSLYSLLNNNKEVLLCKIYNKDKDLQIKEICDYIKNKNKNIEIDINFLK